ncbi:MAG: hypothetical protein E6K72_01245 [Candidatus Eisenbacteria bacterium]|uniref:Uncharacterized protein n=1 Tax=Eiseniibacteriota bacterium TaxID=2212470 RepID=A0A538T8B4_UNCEI|nr:MAG: hypothetical protein E6K72_01245 [Candidatus Eisenbacteria bacterium]
MGRRALRAAQLRARRSRVLPVRRGGARARRRALGGGCGAGPGPGPGAARARDLALHVHARRSAGLEGIGRVTAEAQWHRLHAGLDRPLGAAGRAQLGVAWYDVEPDASAESWRPVFLAFGKTDDRVDALGVRRAQLASVSLGGALRLGGMEGGLALEQFVFARAFRTPPAPVESGNSQAAADAAPGGAKPGGWPGGTRIELTLSRRF